MEKETGKKTRKETSSDVSVILPSYNERENILEAVGRIRKALGGRLKEIIVVDDNSPDETWKLVEDLNEPQVRLMRRMSERGLASALDDGIKAARGEIIAWMDCDLGLPPEDLPRLVNELEGNNGADVAIGSRYAPGGKDLRPKRLALLSTIFNLYAALILGFKVRDYTSGFAAVKREVFSNVSWNRSGFGEYFTEFAYRAVKKGYKVKEIGYIYRLREKGVSKLSNNYFNLIKHGLRYGGKIIKLRLREETATNGKTVGGRND